VAERPIVCDTTVLLYLGRIGQIDLLRALFSAVCVPETVLLELNTGRLFRHDTIDPRDMPWMTSVPVPQVAVNSLPDNRLGAGEQAAIAYAQTHPDHMVGLDDLQARRFAEALDLTVVGTLGILLRAKRTGLIRSVRPLVDAAIEQGFRLNPDIYQDVLKLAKEGE
jgi:predicted nucleic acid-binding protein